MNTEGNKGLLAVLAGLMVCVLFGLSTGLRAGTVIVNEIHYDPPDRRSLEEFVELYNLGSAPIDLSGWYFSSGIDYAFPPGTVIEADAYLVVAQDPEAWTGRMIGVALGPFEGSLASEGERITLRNANGLVEDEVDWQASFPWPLASAGEGASMELIHPLLDNDLGGSWRASSSAPTLPDTPYDLLAPASPDWHWRKGNSEASDPLSAWRARDFAEDASWSAGQTPVGYGDGDDNTVLDDMVNQYSSVFLRRSFEIPGDATIPSRLKLRVYVDDGCIVWVNGFEVGRFHLTSGDKAFDALAQGHEARWEETIVDGTLGVLRTGTNVVAVHAFNQTLGSNDFSIDVHLVVPARDELSPAPTPGARNSVFAENAPPQIRQVAHDPVEPPSGTPIRIQAKVTDPDGVASVRLHYQAVRPGSYIPAYLPLSISQLLATPLAPRAANPAFESLANWTELAMADDGSGGDLVARDGVWTATVPAQSNRVLLRYRVSASDTLAESVLVPYGDDESRNFACFVYDGVPPYTASKLSVHPQGAGHVYPTSVLESLPVYFLVSRAQDLNECIAYNGSYQIPKSNEDARDAFNWEGAFVYEGVVHDHVTFRLRQANDRYGGGGKRSWRIRFPKGNYLAARDQRGNLYPERWRTLNTGKMFDNLRVGNFGLTETLNNELWNTAGVASPWIHTFHFRVIQRADEVPAGPNGQYYGDFWGMSLAFEDYDTRFVRTHGLADGNLYKLKDGIFVGAKLIRHQGRYSILPDADFQNIRMNLRPDKAPDWLDTYVRYDKWYPYHTVVEAVRHYDFVPADSHSKNRAWYFEPFEGSPYGRLWTLPHDSDASWGPNWNSGIDYSTQAIATGANHLPYRVAYRNFIREFRDLLWRDEVIEPWIDTLAGFVREFSHADRDRWRSAPADAGTQDFGAMDPKVLDMKRFAFQGWTGSTGPTVGPGGRAAYLDTLASAESDAASIPRTPTVSALTPGRFPMDALVFETTAFSDPQGDAGFRSMKWRLAEVRDPSLPPPAATDPLILEWRSVWESEEETVFSSRVTIPAWAVDLGHRYRVRVRMTDATGRASHWSEPVEFTASAPDGVLPVVESLRVTEIHYHPPLDRSEEFIELLNTGSVDLDIRDVRLTGGIEFSFASSEVTTLPAGAYVVVARDLAVFRSRYETDSILVAGEFEDKLDNAGESLTLAWGRLVIQEFSYEDAWYPETDGEGRSLVIVDPEGPRELWNEWSGWRASLALGGSPGRPDGESPEGGLLRPGDINTDGSLDISDAIGLLGHLFLGFPEILPCGAGTLADGGNRQLLDENGDGMVDITDAVTLLAFLFQGGPAPVLGVECVPLEGCPRRCSE